MKFDYFTLLSFEPINLHGVCAVKSPTLKEVSKITFSLYDSFLSLLLMDIPSYYSFIDKKGDEYFSGYPDADKNMIMRIRNEYEVMPEDEKSKVSFYDIMIFDIGMRNFIQQSLNFFVEDTVLYNEENHSFFVYDGTEDDNTNLVVTGYIYGKNYMDVVDVILQRNGIKGKNRTEKLKFKTKLAQEIWELTHKDKDEQHDKDMDLGNLISSVAAKDESLNIVNIWDLTVYQLYDQFQRLQGNVFFEISSTSVAAYGDENGKYDGGAWYRNNFDN